jgi:hypothetical protein
VRNILRRKKYKREGNDYSCVLCHNGTEETTFHLFFLCPFSQECWRSLHIFWDLNLDFFSMMEDVKLKFHNVFFHGNLPHRDLAYLEAAECFHLQ